MKSGYFKVFGATVVMMMMMMMMSNILSTKDFCEKKHFKKSIVCYYKGEMSNDVIDPCICTHLVLTNYNIDDKFNLINPMFENVSFVEKLKMRNPHLQVLLSISGDFQNETFMKIALQITNGSSVFTNNLIGFLNQVGHWVDGIELNLLIKEAKHKGIHLNFLQVLREILDENENNNKKYLLMTTFSRIPEHVLYSYDVRTISSFVDFVFLPAFNLTMDEDKIEIFHPSRLMGISDMANADSMVDLVISLGLKPQQLILGVPAFGVSYTHVNANETVVHERQPLPYRQLCENLIGLKKKWIKERDDDQTAVRIYNNQSWIGYDDPKSIRVKCRYSMLRNLAGVGLWTIDDDDYTGKCGQSRHFPLLGTVADAFTITSAPNTDSKIVTKDGFNSSESETMSRRERRASLNYITRIVDRSGDIHIVARDDITDHECTRQGYYRHPRDCGQFYRCVKFNQYRDDFTVFEYNCPPGLVFDERWEVCSWASVAPPCFGSKEIFPIPKNKYVCQAEGYFRDPENCRWFYKCSDFYGDGLFTTFEFRCPFDLAFDEEKLICNWKWLVPSCGEEYGRYGHRLSYEPVRSYDDHYGPVLFKNISAVLSPQNEDGVAPHSTSTGTRHPSESQSRTPYSTYRNGNIGRNIQNGNSWQAPSLPSDQKNFHESKEISDKLHQFDSKVISTEATLPVQKRPVITPSQEGGIGTPLHGIIASDGIGQQNRVTQKQDVTSVTQTSIISSDTLVKNGSFSTKHVTDGRQFFLKDYSKTDPSDVPATANEQFFPHRGTVTREDDIGSMFTPSVINQESHIATHDSDSHSRIDQTFTSVPHISTESSTISTHSKPPTVGPIEPGLLFVTQSTVTWRIDPFSAATVSSTELPTRIRQHTTPSTTQSSSHVHPIDTSGTSFDSEDPNRQKVRVDGNVLTDDTTSRNVVQGASYVTVAPIAIAKPDIPTGFHVHSDINLHETSRTEAPYVFTVPKVLTVTLPSTPHSKDLYQPLSSFSASNSTPVSALFPSGGETVENADANRQKTIQHQGTVTKNTTSPVIVQQRTNIGDDGPIHATIRHIPVTVSNIQTGPIRDDGVSETTETLVSHVSSVTQSSSPYSTVVFSKDNVGTIIEIIGIPLNRTPTVPSSVSPFHIPGGSFEKVDLHGKPIKLDENVQRQHPSLIINQQRNVVTNHGDTYRNLSPITRTGLHEIPLKDLQETTRAPGQILVSVTPLSAIGDRRVSHGQATPMGHFQLPTIQSSDTTSETTEHSQTGDFHSVRNGKTDVVTGYIDKPQDEQISSVSDGFRNQFGSPQLVTTQQYLTKGDPFESLSGHRSSQIMDATVSQYAATHDDHSTTTPLSLTTQTITVTTPQDDHITRLSEDVTQSRTITTPYYNILRDVSSITSVKPDVIHKLYIPKVETQTNYYATVPIVSPTQSPLAEQKPKKQGATLSDRQLSRQNVIVNDVSQLDNAKTKITNADDVFIRLPNDTKLEILSISQQHANNFTKSEDISSTLTFASIPHLHWPCNGSVTLFLKKPDKINFHTRENEANMNINSDTTQSVRNFTAVDKNGKYVVFSVGHGDNNSRLPINIGQNEQLSKATNNFNSANVNNQLHTGRNGNVANEVRNVTLTASFNVYQSSPISHIFYKIRQNGGEITNGGHSDEGHSPVSVRRTSEVHEIGSVLKNSSIEENDKVQSIGRFTMGQTQKTDDDVVRRVVVSDITTRKSKHADGETSTGPKQQITSGRILTETTDKVNISKNFGNVRDILYGTLMQTNYNGAQEQILNAKVQTDVSSKNTSIQMVSNEKQNILSKESGSSSHSVSDSESGSFSPSVLRSESGSFSPSVLRSELESFSRSVPHSESESSWSVPRSESESSPRSVPRSESESSPRSVPRSESESSPRSVPRSESESSPRSVPRSESESSPRSVPRSESESSPRSVPRSESESSSRSVPRSESESSSRSVPRSESESSSRSVPRSESESSSRSVPRSESESSSRSVPRSESESSSRPVPSSESGSSSRPVPHSESGSSSRSVPHSESGSSSLSLPRSESGSSSLSLPRSESGSSSLSLPRSESGPSSLSLPRSVLGSSSFSASHSEPVSSSFPVSHSEPGSSSFSVPHSEPGSSSFSVPHSEPGSSSFSVSHSEPGSSSFSVPHSEPGSSSFSVPHSEPGSSSFSVPHSEPGSSSFSVPHSEPGSSSFSVPHSEPGSSSFSVPHSEPGSSSFVPHSKSGSSSSVFSLELGPLVSRSESEGSAFSVSRSESGPSFPSVSRSESGPSSPSGSRSESGPSSPSVSRSESGPSSPSVSRSESGPSSPSGSRSESRSSSPSGSRSESRSSSPSGSLSESGPSSLSGSLSESGPSSLSGSSSESGPSSSLGSPSESGPSSPSGSRSESGPSSPSGSRSESGPSSPSGSRSESGPSSPSGSRSESGPSSPSGSRSESGPSSPSGSRSESGPSSPSGSRSESGHSSHSGSRSESGHSSLSGSRSESGHSSLSKSRSESGSSLPSGSRSESGSSSPSASRSESASSSPSASRSESGSSSPSVSPSVLGSSLSVSRSKSRFSAPSVSRSVKEHQTQVLVLSSVSGHDFNPGPILCERAGLFRHPDDCNRFYECYWDRWIQKFTLHIFNCPVKLVYDDRINGCNWPAFGPACNY